MNPYTSKLQIKAHFAQKDFDPNGDLRKPVWKRANWISFDHDWAGKKRYPNSRTQVAACWTSEHIYLAYHCRYSILNLFEDGDPAKDTMGLWNRDVVEAFLNPNPARVNHYYEFEVAPNNLWIDLEIDLDHKLPNPAGWNSGFVHVTHIGNTTWTCEARIPVAPMTNPKYRLRAGIEWRGNFFRADGDGDDSQRRLLAWSPTLTPKPQFHVPTRFGLIRFVR